MKLHVIIKKSYSKQNGTMELFELLGIVLTIERTNCVDVRIIVTEDKRTSIKTMCKRLLYWFPIIMVQNQGVYVALKCNQFRIETPVNIFSEMLNLNVIN